MNFCPSPLLSGSTLSSPTPLPWWISILYTRIQWGRLGGGGWYGVLSLIQINTFSKVPLPVNFFRWRHFAMPSMSLIFLLNTSPAIVFLLTFPAQSFKESATIRHLRQGIYRLTLSIIGRRLGDKSCLVGLLVPSSSLYTITSLSLSVCLSRPQNCHKWSKYFYHCCPKENRGLKEED